MQAFPLQHKKMQCLTLPYLRVGTCEIMNTSSHYMMDSFNAYNAKNTPVYAQTAASTQVPFLGEMVSGGLVDSYTGGTVSRFVAAYLSRALSLHTIVPEHLRDLRKEFPEDPLVDLMLTSTQRHRSLHQPALRFSNQQRQQHHHHHHRADMAVPQAVITDQDLKQYAISTDAAFFKACDILRVAQSSTSSLFGGMEEDNSTRGSNGTSGGGDGGRQLTGKAPGRLSPYEKSIADLLVKAIDDAAPCAPPAATSGSNSSNTNSAVNHENKKGISSSSSSADALRGVKDSGCRAAWFAATVVPSSMELQRRIALLQASNPSIGQGSLGSNSGVAPLPRKTLADPSALLKKEIEELTRVLQAQPFCLDVLVSNVGDSRAFGIARNAHTEGSKSLLDPTRERVVPLSIDHRIFRQEEFHRIVQAGGKADSAAGEVIDGNPFYNVSRSFGHWAMKNNPHRSPVQQKLSALPHTASWRMLQGDVLVLANHAVFETRQDEDSSVDEVAKVVGRELDRGATPEQAAAAVCDFAVRFGAPHSLQVMVAVAAGPAMPLAHKDEVGTGTPQRTPCDYAEWVESGPLYVEACRRLGPLRDAFERDCARCGVRPEEMIGKRWERVRALLPMRHALSLMPYYGRECGALQQVMEEEAMFFDQDTLRLAAEKHQEQEKPSSNGGVSDDALRESFKKLASSLLGAKRR